MASEAEIGFKPKLRMFQTILPEAPGRKQGGGRKLYLSLLLPARSQETLLPHP